MGREVGFFPKKRADIFCIYCEVGMLRRKLAPRLVIEKRHHIPPGQFPFTVKNEGKVDCHREKSCKDLSEKLARLRQKAVKK